jgi:hypothetical protein
MLSAIVIDSFCKGNHLFEKLKGKRIIFAKLAVLNLAFHSFFRNSAIKDGEITPSRK